MKKNSKNFKKNKNSLTAFGQTLKSAIDKSISEKEVENNPPKPRLIGKDSSKNAPVKTENTFSKPNLTYKLGDASFVSSDKKTAAQTKSQNSISSQTDNPKHIPTPLKSSATASAGFQKNTTVGEKKTPSTKANAFADTPNAAVDNAEKYLNLMREKFWENVEGEALGGQQGRSLRINLGIDLGTSFSKVVYRLGGESFPVRFGTNKNNIEDYLMPSVVVIGKKGIKCRFEFDDEEKLKKAVQISNFKICLTCERGDGEVTDCSITKCSLSNLKSGYLPNEVTGEEASFLTAFYLAKLLARVKEAVRRQLPEREIPLDITIKWSANLAVPDKFLDSDVAEGFRESLEIGWLISEVFHAHPNFSNKQESIVCYLEAKKLHAEIKAELLMQRKDFDCFTYSEIGAEVASVTLSPTSEEGLYVLVDVGAGTVDTSVFRFRRVDGESVQETYAANVFKLGAAQIEARTNASFMRTSLNWLRQIKENVFRQNADEAMIHITEEISLAESAVITELYEKLITLYAEAFPKENIKMWSKLKLVMGGGGSAIKSYGETARKALSPKIEGASLIEFSSLKIPADFQMGTIPASQFHRFAVAYGLSRERIELPELVPANDVKSMNSLRQKIYIDPTNDG